jgi:hypothetical protein
MYQSFGMIRHFWKTMKPNDLGTVVSLEREKIITDQQILAQTFSTTRTMWKIHTIHEKRLPVQENIFKNKQMNMSILQCT